MLKPAKTIVVDSMLNLRKELLAGSTTIRDVKINRGHIPGRLLLTPAVSHCINTIEPHTKEIDTWILSEWPKSQPSTLCG